MIKRLAISTTIFTATNPLKFTCQSGTRVSKILFSSIHATESAMGVTKQQVESALTSKLAPSHMVVIDTSGGCGASFAVEIVSEQFQGKRLLDRHRLVNGALAEEMKEIHALSITKALTPDQWKQQQQDSEKSQAAT